MSAIRHADGGTLFWTKWPTCPFHAGQTLARDSRKAVRRIGDATEQPVDVRIVCATHKTSKPLSKAAHSAKTCITVSMSSASICRPCVKCAKI
ncbi:Rsp [Neisseria gonorrhoeae]|uniref:Rsp n=1 Tax=Neisseria gonorrhoeae TaxID=485 RepID=A0A378VUE0_NEIGO|nr:Rsp [Neisseria gonorrhoeae]